MNSIAWSENKRMLEDTINDYCNEEAIEFDVEKKSLFENLLNYFKDKISSADDIKDINMKVLQQFVNIIQNSNSKDSEQQSSQNIYQNNKNQNRIEENSKTHPKQIYSRDDIMNKRNLDFQNKLNHIREDFANFKLKKPNEIDFSDKNTDDDNTSIDKRIEMELQRRQYDTVGNTGSSNNNINSSVSGIKNEPPKDVVDKFKQWISNPNPSNLPNPTNNIDIISNDNGDNGNGNNNGNGNGNDDNDDNDETKKVSFGESVTIKYDNDVSTDSISTQNTVSIFDKLKKISNKKNINDHSGNKTDMTYNQSSNFIKSNEEFSHIKESIGNLENKINEINDKLDSFLSVNSHMKIIESYEKLFEVHTNKISDIHKKIFTKISELETNITNIMQPNNQTIE